MEQFLLSNEATVRLTVFFGMLAAVGLAETIRPRRALTVIRWFRWLNNLALVFLNSAVLRVLFPTLAVGAAALFQARGIGLFNLLDLPFWLEIAASIVLLDLVIYAQHIAFHKVPVLWRVHRMHHADLDFDVTTGARFHPIEIVLSMVLKLAVVAVLGPPAVAVLIFEIVLNGLAMFNHGNVAIPTAIDRYLRLLIVTPDMHRVHHSIRRNETDSNFGFNLPWWDRLFGTYRAQPADGHLAMTIGQPDLQQPRRQNLWWMLVLPLKSRPN